MFYVDVSNCSVAAREHITSCFSYFVDIVGFSFLLLVGSNLLLLLDHKSVLLLQKLEIAC